jgi:hypothetical protein
LWFAPRMPEELPLYNLTRKVLDFDPEDVDPFSMEDFLGAHAAPSVEPAAYAWQTPRPRRFPRGD